MSTETTARPARFADYLLARFLGEGLESRVFAAKPPARLGAPSDLVALKILHEPTELGRFRVAAAELQCVRCLQSPAIVTLYEAGRGENGTMYCAMEYAGGGSLATPARHLGREDVLKAVARAARAVHTLHEAGIVHRAIRPGAVVLTEGGGKLAEPDLIHLLWPGRTFHALHPPAHVQYVDPALIRGEPPSRTSDIWALGVTLHVALTGKPIYYGLGPDLLGALRIALTGTPIIHSTLTRQDAELVSMCLADNPGDRPPSALEVAERIEHVLGLDAPVHSLVHAASEQRAVPPAGGPPGFETLPLWTTNPPDARDAAARPRGRPSSLPMVEGLLCRRGHINYSGASYCVSCGISLLQASRRLVERPRPSLGVLILDDGNVCMLDTDFVIGREPSRDPTVQDGTARPLRLDDMQHLISAMHADIRLDGWRVLLVDRGSANGTRVRPSTSEEWTRLDAGEPVELHSRTAVRIGQREFVFTSNRER